MRDDENEIASAGAAQDIKQGNGVWFLASVNGGIWRTASIQEKVPRWENVLDGSRATCSSIAALHVSGNRSNRIYGGCGGSTSSEQGSDWNVVNSGEWGGLMRSLDGGNTWDMLPGFPRDFYITAILELSSTNLLVSAQSNLYNRSDAGIWQSRDDGYTFLLAH